MVKDNSDRVNRPYLEVQGTHRRSALNHGVLGAAVAVIMSNVMAAVWNWAECIGVPAMLPRPEMSGMIGMALTLVADTTCQGFSTRSLPSTGRTVSAHATIFSF
jgi:hypothetical protein